MSPPDRRPRPRDPRSIRLAAVGDLHTTVESATQYRPAQVRAAAEADVLLLAGDLTHMAHVDQARALAAELWDLGIKTMAVTGNDDHQQGREKAIAGVLTGAGVHMLEGASVVLSIRGTRWRPGAGTGDTRASTRRGGAERQPLRTRQGA